jgi:hypothetical protein
VNINLEQWLQEVENYILGEWQPKRPTTHDDNHFGQNKYISYIMERSQA